MGDSAAANPYAYGGDAPLTNTDPSGHNVLALAGAVFCPECAVVVAAGIIITVGAYYAYKTYQDNHSPTTHESGFSASAPPLPISLHSRHVVHRAAPAPAARHPVSGPRER